VRSPHGAGQGRAAIHCCGTCLPTGLADSAAPPKRHAATQRKCGRRARGEHAGLHRRQRCYRVRVGNASSTDIGFRLPAAALVWEPRAARARAGSEVSKLVAAAVVPAAAALAVVLALGVWMARHMRSRQRRLAKARKMYDASGRAASGNNTSYSGGLRKDDSTAISTIVEQMRSGQRSGCMTSAQARAPAAVGRART